MNSICLQVTPINQNILSNNMLISLVDLFYIPSFLRGERGNGMAVLEPRRSVGRPRGSQGEGMTI